MSVAEFSAFDRQCMARALELAARGLPTTDPNPRVGCVIAKDGVVLESCRYRYDARGRRRVAQLQGPPATNRLHAFDARDRLTGVRFGFAAAPLGDGAYRTEVKIEGAKLIIALAKS